MAQLGNNILVYLNGTAILKTCKISSNISSLVQGSFSFQGTGELVKKNS